MKVWFVLQKALRNCPKLVPYLCYLRSFQWSITIVVKIVLRNKQRRFKYRLGCFTHTCWVLFCSPAKQRLNASIKVFNRMFQLNVITAIILIIIAILLRLTYIIIMNACRTKRCTLPVSPLLQKRKIFENNSLVLLYHVWVY